MERSGVLFTAVIRGTVLKVKGFNMPQPQFYKKSPVLLGPSPYEEAFNG